MSTPQPSIATRFGRKCDSVRMFRLSRPTFRSILALVVFFGLCYLASHVEQYVLGPVMMLLKEHSHLRFQSQFGPLPAVPVNVLTLIVIVRSFYAILITGVALKIAKRTWSSTGLFTVNGLRHYGAGCVAGFLAVSALILLMSISGGLIFDGLRMHGTDAILYGLRWLVGMVLVGLEEESINRGYLLLGMSEIFGALPAALLTSLLFAAAHMGNQGETPLGLLQVFAFGLLCAFNIVRTGSLWWAMAFHAIWNWTQEFFYGTLGSGYWFDGHFLQFRPQGAKLISGGTVGPEGSIYVFAILGAMILYEVIQLRRHGSLIVPMSTAAPGF